MNLSPHPSTSAPCAPGCPRLRQRPRRVSTFHAVPPAQGLHRAAGRRNPSTDYPSSPVGPDPYARPNPLRLMHATDGETQSERVSLAVSRWVGNAELKLSCADSDARHLARPRLERRERAEIGRHADFLALGLAGGVVSAGGRPSGHRPAGAQPERGAAATFRSLGVRRTVLSAGGLHPTRWAESIAISVR